jgi:hypothetical protein
MLAIASVFNATRGPGDGPVTLVTSLAYSRHNFSKLWWVGGAHLDRWFVLHNARP